MKPFQISVETWKGQVQLSGFINSADTAFFMCILRIIRYFIYRFGFV
jgi:hypothetical protein